MHHAICIAASTLGSLAACGAGGGPTGYGGANPPPSGQQPPPANTTSSIVVQNNRYAPASTTVGVGTTVTWTWDSCSDDGYGGRSCVNHTVTFDGGATSPNQSAGTFARQFTAAGTYDYHCTVHGTSMTGRIVVQ